MIKIWKNYVESFDLGWNNLCYINKNIVIAMIIFQVINWVIPYTILIVKFLGEE